MSEHVRGNSSSFSTAIQWKDFSNVKPRSIIGRLAHANNAFVNSYMNSKQSKNVPDVGGGIWICFHGCWINDLKKANVFE